MVKDGAGDVDVLVYGIESQGTEWEKLGTEKGQGQRPGGSLPFRDSVGDWTGEAGGKSTNCDVSEAKRKKCFNCGERNRPGPSLLRGKGTEQWSDHGGGLLTLTWTIYEDGGDRSFDWNRKRENIKGRQKL